MDKSWYLESIAADESHVRQSILQLPFRIGRDLGNDLVVDARGLSRRHAEIMDDGAGGLCVKDLGSTNGTFVNGQRVSALMPLAEGNVLHFGNAEYRLLQAAVETVAPTLPADDCTLLVMPGQRLSARFVPEEAQFRQFLAGQGLAAAAQPIVQIGNGQRVAFELLGRCTHSQLKASPMQLFVLAERLGCEAELSDAFRRHGVVAMAPHLQGARLFVNTHPSETFADHFLPALVALRAQAGAPRLVVEVHETAVMEVRKMRELAARLADIDVEFAYDDFGAGQARLNELGEVPAHFVKFDMGLIRDIHLASDRKQRVVRDLVKLVLDLGSVPLAEGVEQQAESDLCRDMGFALVQGYLTGRPVLVTDMAQPRP